MWWWIAGCAWLVEPVDVAALEAVARHHRDAIAAAAPSGGDCDGLEEIVAGRSPEGCRFRPAASLEEAGAVARRCTDLLTESAESPIAGTIGPYGAWAAAPVPLSTCAILVAEQGTGAQRSRLPPDAIVAHGALWEAWLLLRDLGASDALMRDWASREASCGDPVSAACHAALEQPGSPIAVEMGSVLEALRDARALKR